MTQPNHEARISNIEKESISLGARIEELSADTAEEFKALRQEIRQGYVDIGKALDSHANALMQEIRRQATKEDLASLKATQDARFDSMQSDIASIKATQEQILKLLQQKSGE